MKPETQHPQSGVSMWAAIWLTVLLVVLAACGANEGGFGAPAQESGEFGFDFPGKPVVGTLLLAPNGCWYADMNGTERLVVLPPGFRQSARNGAELVNEGGDVFRHGDRFDAVGYIVWAVDVPGGADGKWGNYMSFCQPEVDQLAVFTSLDHEFDPTTLSTTEQSEMLSTAVFTEHFSCGRGWATSTADQRVGVVVYEAEPADVLTGRIDLPHRNWNASVLIGKNLFSEHCNDAIEEWIALPTIAAQWPLASGTITISDPIPSLEDAPARVRAALHGGRADTGAGLVPFPAVELDNPSFNFFAG